MALIPLFLFLLEHALSALFIYGSHGFHHIDLSAL